MKKYIILYILLGLQLEDLIVVYNEDLVVEETIYNR